MVRGIYKYGFYEQEIFRKERKEFQRTLRRIFKRHYKLNTKDSEIMIKSDYRQKGAINWKNPTVTLEYQDLTLSFDSEELDIIYSLAFSNKFSGRFHPLDFFDYIRERNKTKEEKDYEKRKKRKRIVNGTCEYCGNTDTDRMEYLFIYGKLYHKCAACKNK
jgi:hypothetical protein